MNGFVLIEDMNSRDTQATDEQALENIANMDGTDWMSMLLEMRILGA